MSDYRLLLINPESRHAGMGRKFKFAYPSNALLAVAALTPSNFDIKVVDEIVEDINLAEPADLVGITAMTPAAMRAYELAQNFRDRGIPVVLGGIHPTALPEEASAHADAVLVGEAEELWPLLLEDFQKGQLRKIYRHPPGYFPDLAQMPLPRRDLLDRHKFFPAQIVEASRGCPFHCEFCAVTTFFGGRYRLRPVSEVEKEIRLLDNHPPRQGLRRYMSPFPKDIVFFADSDITANRTYALQLFAMLARYPDIYWHGYSTIEVSRDSELLAAAARSGCIGLGIGFESLSLANIKTIGKRYDPKGYLEGVQRIRDHGIAIMGSFLAGLDDDGVEVFDQILEFVNEKARLESCFYMIPAPLPGTRFHKRMQAQGRIIDTNWDHYDSSHVVYQPQKMTPEQLVEGFWRLWRESYRYKSIFRRVWKHPYFSFFMGMNYGMRMVIKQMLPDR